MQTRSVDGDIINNYNNEINILNIININMENASFLKKVSSPLSFLIAIIYTSTLSKVD